MKFKKFLFLFLISTIVYAEGGSGYTRIGLGDLYLSYSARRASFGGLGASLFDIDNVGYYNPASWTRLKLARFETGINVESLFTKDENKSSFFSNASFSGFILGFPIQKDYGISLVMGIVPYSKVKLNTSVLNPDYDFKFQGEGGISKIFVGGSYSLPFDLNFGASLDYYVGTIDYYSNIIFNDENIRNSEFNTKLKLSGLGGSFGVISNDLSKVFGLEDIKNLRLGATISLAKTFDVDTSLNQLIYTGEKASILSNTTLTTGKSDIELPIKLGTGLSFNTGKFHFLFDYLFQSWGNYKYKGLADKNLRNLQKIYAGLEYQSTMEPSADFWKQIILRGGLSFEQTQYKINGKGIDQYSILAGLSIPLDYGSTIDFALEYGLRGTTDFNLLKENIFKFTLSFNFGELWFYRGER